jgi:serine/threonine protein phosphatase PrpC
MVQEENNIQKALLQTINILQELTADDVAGSTLSAAFLPENTASLHICTIGDSPLIVRKQSGEVHIYPDDPEIFGQTVKKSFGSKTNIDLIREGDYYEIDIAAGDCILIATDGIYNKTPGRIRQQSETLMEHIQQGADAAWIVNNALQRETGDNVTAIVIKVLA